MSLDVNFALTDDDYTDSQIGLTSTRGSSMGADFSAALSETTQLRLYAQSEHLRSSMAGSQTFSLPDWTGRTDDEIGTFGLGVTHLAMKGKLELAGDLTTSRADTDTLIQQGTIRSFFPTARTSLDNLKLRAKWQQSAKLTWLGSFEYEHYDADDWHLDGIAPGTVPNLLSLGEQAPNYNVTVIRVAVRYRF